MKKVLPFGILLLFSWFQGYQLCDESQDACAALEGFSQKYAQNTSTWRSSTAPYDDADANVPLVLGQALTHNSSVTDRPSIWRPVSFSLHSLQASPPFTLMKDRSPPRPRLSEVSPVISSLLFHHTSLQILAPPLI